MSIIQSQGLVRAATLLQHVLRERLHEQALLRMLWEIGIVIKMQG